MIGIQVSRRYAKALVALLDSREQLEEVGRLLRAYQEMIDGSSELRAVLLNPSISMQVKQAIQDQLLNRIDPPRLARQFLNLLLKKNRLRHLDVINVLYDELVNERLNRIHAKVTTRFPLSQASAEQMRQRLSQVTGKEVILDAEVDASVLGGVVTQIGGMVLDGSLRNQLRVIRDELVRSTS